MCERGGTCQELYVDVNGTIRNPRSHKARLPRVRGIDAMGGVLVLRIARNIVALARFDATLQSGALCTRSLSIVRVQRRAPRPID